MMVVRDEPGSLSKVLSRTFGKGVFLNYRVLTDKEHNLTQWEVGYCCLFLMGLYSKDIEPHFSRASSNTNNNIIRNKLGLPLNGQKLKTYLLETCKKLES